MQCGLPCPQYIKSVKINNKSAEVFKVSVTFDSGKSEDITIGSHEIKSIQNLLHQDGCSFVDPVKSLKGHSASKNNHSLELTAADAKNIDRKYFEVEGDLSVHQKEWQ